MSPAIAFPTKWHFLVARVLIGVDRTSGVFTGTSHDGAEHVCVWTSEKAIEASVDHARFDIRQIEVETLLGILPAGVGVVADIGSEAAMWVDPDYAVQLKKLAHPFPPGCSLSFRDWVDLPVPVADRMRAELGARDFVRSAFALIYTIDDSPAFGLIAYEVDGAAESEESAINAVVRALDGVSLAELDVATVRILGVADLPPDLLAALPRRHPLYAKS